MVYLSILGALAPTLLASVVSGAIVARTGNSTTNSWTVGQGVQTKSGIVYGHPAPNATEVSEYLRIPYAQAPLGNLRFMVPEAYTGSGIINSTTFPLNCPQPGIVLPGSTSPPVNFAEYLNAVGRGNTAENLEDCLYLNVWTKPQTGEAKKAVMVWFYPGGFRSGGTNNKGYNGQYYAENEDIIVVTFNYRVGSLGFASTGANTPNVGLFDQRLAVQWVRDNIAGFGGDPDRIIAWGESAGAAGIDLYNYNYPDDPIIAGSIMESGSYLLATIQSEAVAEGLWSKLVTTVGCSAGTPQQVLACMQAVPLDVLEAAELSVSGGGYAFAPVADNSTAYVDYVALEKVGHFIKKPVLVGNNEYEAAWFKLTISPNLGEAYYESVNLGAFTCASRNQAELRREWGIESWRYRFFPTFPQTTHQYNSSLAMHTSEVPIVWGTYDDSIPVVGSTADQRSLSAFMMKYWATFAKDPVNGLSNAGWPVYSPTSNSLQYLGNKYFGQDEFVLGNARDASCPLRANAFCLTALSTNP